VNRGKNRKSQGIEGSANANDVWVWMRPHIRFCTIGNCDLLSFFFDKISPNNLQISSSLFFFLFLETWSFSNEVLPLLLFNPCSFSSSFFLGSFVCWGEIPLIRIF
jgi:hypothetical protein